jgi:hypothetical protein
VVIHGVSLTEEMKKCKKRDLKRKPLPAAACLRVVPMRSEIEIQHAVQPDVIDITRVSGA